MLMLSGGIYPGSLRLHEMRSVKNVSFVPWCYFPHLSGTKSVSYNEQKKKNNLQHQKAEQLWGTKFSLTPRAKNNNLAVYWMELYIHPQ